MSLDVGLAHAKTISPYPSMSISFEDDGYYWFCHPFFEDLEDATGEMIDLYGGAWFEGAQLDQLAETLDEIRAKAMTFGEEFEALAGYSLGSGAAPTEPIAINKPVRRETLIRLLDAFQSLVRQAKERIMWIACLGD